MGLLSMDLARYRQFAKTAAQTKPEKAVTDRQDPIDRLRVALELYVGADQSIEKTASQDDLARLYEIHRMVEREYRTAVKVGKKPEADALLDKFSGWKYLKGAPGEPGDMHPLPAPSVQ